jgi:hypothetical protein
MILGGVERPSQSPSSLMRSAARGARPWLVAYARAGHVAKGMVYLMVGILALQSALGSGGQVTDSAGALAAIYHQPFGKIALFAIGLGLLGFASLRLVQAVADPERRGHKPNVLLIRVGEGLTGLAHALLAWGAFRMVTVGQRVPTGDQNTRVLTHELLAVPHGDALVTGLGLLVAAIGAFMLFRALTIKDVCADLALERLPPRTCRLIGGILRFGRGVQGALFCAVGIFLIRAGISQRSGHALGSAGAIRHLVHMNHGELLLGLIALGLIAVAVSSFIDARYRRFPAPRPL